MSSDTPFNHISQTHAPTNHTPTARFDPPHESRGYSRLPTDSNEELTSAETADDLSVELSLAWNDTAFYLAARVIDNVHDIEGGEEHQWYLKDAITLFLDIPSDGDGPGWIEGDHAFAFITDRSMWGRRGERVAHIESPAPKDTRMAMQKTPTGYTLEASIPPDGRTHPHYL